MSDINVTKLSCLAVLGVWGLISGAQPTLSGSYLTNISSLCQMIVTVDSSTGLFTFKNGNALGSTVGGPGTLSFDSAGGTYSQSAVSYEMSNVLEEFTDGRKKGNRVTSGVISSSGNYSNTDATLTLSGGGASAVYHIVYGSVDQSNVAHAFVATTKFDNNHCIFTIQAQSQ